MNDNTKAFQSIANRLKTIPKPVRRYSVPQQPARIEDFFAEITSGNGPYAWKRLKPDGAGGFADWPGPVEGGNAYELHAITSVPAGTRVRMRLVGAGASGPIYVFDSDPRLQVNAEDDQWHYLADALSADETWITKQVIGNHVVKFSHSGPATPDATWQFMGVFDIVEISSGAGIYALRITFYPLLKDARGHVVRVGDVAGDYRIPLIAKDVVTGLGWDTSTAILRGDRERVLTFNIALGNLDPIEIQFGDCAGNAPTPTP